MSVESLEKILTICWFQLLRYKKFMLFFVIYENNLTVFERFGFEYITMGSDKVCIAFSPLCNGNDYFVTF